MNLRVINDIYKNRKFVSSKKLTIKQLFTYFIKLKIGEFTGDIYKGKSGQTLSSDEIKLMTKSFLTLDSVIRDTLNKIRINNFVNISEKIGLENIGNGCLITPLLGNLLFTQGEASFYFSARQQEKFDVKLVLFTIPKISGVIKLEDNIIRLFSIPSLSEQIIHFEIKSEDIINKIFRITVSTNRHWYPNYLDLDTVTIPIGIAVKSIEVK